MRPLTFAGVAWRPRIFRAMRAALAALAAALAAAAPPPRPTQSPAARLDPRRHRRPRVRPAAPGRDLVPRPHGAEAAGRSTPTAQVLYQRIKAMLLITYLQQPGVRDRDLTAADRALLDPMIRRSGNIAATRVRDIVGNAALERLARRAHMTRFAVHPVWGVSRISARPDAPVAASSRSCPRPPPRLRGPAGQHDRRAPALGLRAHPRRLGSLLQGRLGLGHRPRRTPGGAAAPRRGARGDRDPHDRQPLARVREADAAGCRPPAARTAPP